MKWTCENPTVGFMLFCHCSSSTLIWKILAKLKHFSTLDFQSKREVINNGRPMQGFSWVKMGLRCSKKKCARCARSLCYHVTWYLTFYHFINNEDMLQEIILLPL